MNEGRSSRRCVFFDRDGVVNEAPPKGYVLRWEDFRLQPAFVESLRIVTKLGYEGIVVTNQRCVSLGLVSIETITEIHSRLMEMLQREFGLRLLDILVCPHDEGMCECRKPKPGLLLEAAVRHGIDLGSSWMVGDQDRDIEAGRAAGCRTIRVGKGGTIAADYEAAAIEELPSLLERVLPVKSGEEPEKRRLAK